MVKYLLEETYLIKFLMNNGPYVMIKIQETTIQNVSKGSLGSDHQKESISVE